MRERGIDAWKNNYAIVLDIQQHKVAFFTNWLYNITHTIIFFVIIFVCN